MIKHIEIRVNFRQFKKYNFLGFLTFFAENGVIPSQFDCNKTSM